MGRSPALASSAAIHFAMNYSAPCFAVLRRPPSSRAAVILVGVDAESSEVVQETPHPLLFFLAPIQPTPPTDSPNITHFGSPVPSVRATNPANKSPLHEVASLLSLSVLINKRVQIENRAVAAVVLSPTNAASQETVVRSAQRVAVARARAPRDAAVQHCLEYLGS